MTKRLLSALLIITVLFTTVICFTIPTSAEDKSQVNYVEHQASIYASMSPNIEDSLSANFYNNLKSDKIFQASIVAWETLHIVDSPSHALESGMIYKGDFYKIAIFEILDASNENSTMSYILNSVYSDRESALYELTYDVAEFFNKDYDELSTISIDEFKRFIKDFDLENFCGDVKNDFIDPDTSPVSAIGIVFDSFTNASEAIDAMASYRAVYNMRNGVLQLLNEIANDSENDIYLRLAAKQCVPLFNDNYNKMLNDIALGIKAFGTATIKTVASLVLDTAWDAFVSAIPLGGQIVLGVKGFRALANAAFDMDGRIELYYKLQAAVLIERATIRVLDKTRDAYNASPSEESATLYMEAVWLYQKALIHGTNCAIDYLSHYSDTLGTQIILWITSKYDDLENTISTYKKFRNDKVYYFSALETKVKDGYTKNSSNYAEVIDKFNNQIEPPTPSTSNTSKYKGSDYTSDPKMASLIDSVFASYPPGTSFFTKNGKACSCHTNNSFSCVDSPKACNCLRKVTVNGKTVDLSGVQCLGYARYWQVALFGSHEKNSSNFKKLSGVSGKLTKANTKSWFEANKDALHPGTHIRVYGSGHSIVLLDVNYSKDTVTYIQCNWTSQSKNNGAWCKVGNVLTKSWSEFASTYSSLDYAYVYKNYNSEFSSSTTSLTVNYDANGGTIPESVLVGEVYKVTTASLNVRAEPTTSSTRLGGITSGVKVTVLEKKKQSDYTWGKISYNGKIGWIALDSSWVTKTGDEWSPNYYLNGSTVYKKSDGKIHSQVMTCGLEVSKGLTDADTLGLTREGYIFIGWSLSPTGGEIIDQSMAFKPEELVPAITGGSKTVTVYAIWERVADDIYDPTVEHIYISSVPQKEIYTVGEAIDTSQISIIVMHSDGSCEIVYEGFTCSPSVIEGEGNQSIEVTYHGCSASFTVNTLAPKSRAVNAVAKSNSTGYLLPSTSAATLSGQGVWKDDKITVLCRDGEFYLCLIPWGDTQTNKTNGVLLYVKASDVQLNSTVANADEYYASIDVTVTKNTTVYYKPDGGANPVKYNDKVIEGRSVTAGDKLKLLFELDGYYCVQTDKFTGFISKDAVSFKPTLTSIDTNVSSIEEEAGNSFDPSVIEVTGVMSDGSTVSITDFELDLPSFSVAGESYATVNVGDLTAVIKVTITEPEVSEIVLLSYPQKTAYLQGEEFDPTGLSLMLVYDNGTTRNVSDGIRAEFNSDECGTVLVRIVYDRFSIYLPVTVYSAPEVSLQHTDAYAGQTVTVPLVYYSYSDSNITPSSFMAIISYDSSKLVFEGIAESELYDSSLFIVSVLDGGTVQIIYEDTKAIDTDKALANLEFTVFEGDGTAEPNAFITINRFELYDGLGNVYAATVSDGSIFNLGQLSVILNTNGSADTAETIYVNYGDSVTLPHVAPSREGFTFVGWSFNETDGEPEHFSGDIIEVKENLIFYAVWVEDTAEESTDENAGDVENIDSTEPVDDSVEDSIEDSIEDPVYKPSSGCRSSMLGGILTIILSGVALAAFISKKKRQ